MPRPSASSLEASLSLSLSFAVFASPPPPPPKNDRHTENVAPRRPAGTTRPSLSATIAAAVGDPSAVSPSAKSKSPSNPSNPSNVRKGSEPPPPWPPPSETKATPSFGFFPPNGARLERSRDRSSGAPSEAEAPAAAAAAPPGRRLPCSPVTDLSTDHTMFFLILSMSSRHRPTKLACVDASSSSRTSWNAFGGPS